MPRQESGKRGGLARAKNLSPKERTRIATLGGLARGAQKTALKAARAAGVAQLPKKPKGKAAAVVAAAAEVAA